MQFKLSMVVTACGVWSGAGHAACGIPYTAGNLGEDISTMSSALQNSQPTSFQEAGASLMAGIPCIKDPMAPIVLASVYRYAGLQAYFGGRESEARAWWRSALEIDSTFDWDVSELSIDDPIRPIFEMERDNSSAEKVPVAGEMILRIPDGLRLTADGRPLTKAALTINRPHLIQSISKADNTVQQVWLVDGNQLPEELVVHTGFVKSAAGPASGAGSSVDVERIERARPPLKTPSLIAGGVFMAAGVGLYAASFATRGKFESATTLNQAKAHRATTNTLVLSASGAFIAGAGLTYAGFMMDGTPGVYWRGSF